MKRIFTMIRTAIASGSPGSLLAEASRGMSSGSQDSAGAAISPGIAAVARELLTYSDARDRESARVLAAEARGYARGAAEGYALGIADRLEQASADQREIAVIVRHLADRPDAAELERRRWSVRGEPRTRETFAAPHPGDRGPFSAAQLAAIAAAWEGAR